MTLEKMYWNTQTIVSDSAFWPSIRGTMDAPDLSVPDGLDSFKGSLIGSILISGVQFANRKQRSVVTDDGAGKL